MKLLSSNNGSAVIHVLGDAVTPEKGLLSQDLINFVGDLYHFAVRPPPQALFSGVPLIFQGGKFMKDGEIYPILQLLVAPNGDMISASTTDTAEIILLDFIEKLNTGLDYRFNLENNKITYLSNLIVQFDKFGNPSSAFSKISLLLASAMPHPDKTFRLKRIAFGDGDISQGPVMNLEQAENVDFMIEHRNGTPNSENIFYCGAAMRTSEHIKLLEQIEEILAA
jgi:hypothetical protein